MDAIATWLNNPTDYFKGLELLKSNSTDTFTLSILSTGPDTYNTRKLYAELDKIKKIATEQIAIREKNKPAELVDQELTAEQLMDTRAELKARLRFLVNDPSAQTERKELAFQILSITGKLDDIFEQKEFYDKHGYVPTGELDIDDEPMELLRRQRNLRTYVTKYKTKDPDKAAAFAEELKVIDVKLKKHVV